MSALRSSPGQFPRCTVHTYTRTCMWLVRMEHGGGGEVSNVSYYISRTINSQRDDLACSFALIGPPKSPLFGVCFVEWR